MEMRLPTVRVRKGDGWHVINESDFDPAVHKLWEAEAEPEAEIAAEPEADLSSLKVEELKEMAAARGIDVEGSGPGGRVTKGDLLAALG